MNEESSAGPAPLSFRVGRRLALVFGLTVLSAVLVGGVLNGFLSPEKIGLLLNAGFGPVNWGWIAAALAAHGTHLFFEACLLKTVAVASGRSARLGPMLRVYLVGNIAAQLTPSAIGGEPAQLFVLSRDGYPLADGSFLLASRAFLSVVARLVLLAGIGLVGIPARTWPKSAGWNTLAALTAGALILFYIGLYFFFISAAMRIRIARLAGKYSLLRRLFQCRNAGEFQGKYDAFALRFRTLAVRLGREKPFFLAAGGLFSLFSWVSAKSAPFFILAAFGESPAWPVVIAAGIMAQVASSWAPTPGAVGAVEAAQAAFFFPLITRGDPAALLPLFVLLFRFFELPLNVLVLLPFLPRLFPAVRVRNLRAPGRSSEESRP